MALPATLVRAEMERLEAVISSARLINTSIIRQELRDRAARTGTQTVEDIAMFDRCMLLDAFSRAYSDNNEKRG